MWSCGRTWALTRRSQLKRVGTLNHVSALDITVKLCQKAIVRFVELSGDFTEGGGRTAAIDDVFRRYTPYEFRPIALPQTFSPLSI